MMQGLSLDQAPPYNIPLRFYITGGVYLVLFGVLTLFFGLHVNSRHDYEAIALTHLMTLGFFSHIMIGSMFQMIPVMFGLAYKNVVDRSKIIYILLNLGTLVFTTGFLTKDTALIELGGSGIATGIVFFALISLETVLQSVEKDFLLKNFITAFVLFFVGTFFGFLAVLGQSGITDSVMYGDIHMAFMLFGWVFILINGVSYKIVPMFFVAKEFPLFLRNYLYLFMVFVLVLFTLARLNDLFFLTHLFKLFLGFGVVVFASYTIVILKNRKRSRRDVSIDLWYFSMTNMIVAVFLGIVDDYTQNDLSLAVAFFALFGGAYTLINAMLYKIVPFLTWFHLSSNMVFEAEMSEVIKKKQMVLQVRFYFVAYGLFLGSLFWIYLLIPASLVFVLSSILLLKNLLGGYKYYQIYIKKKIDMSNFS